MNADGHLDYLSATFAGTTHLAMGTEKGFDQPEQMRDRNGEFILISSYWDFDQGDHLDTGRSMPDGEAVNERCTSALAFDWDNDGDYDLLLGSYDGGRLFLQMNEGTATEPQFSGSNIPVMTGGVPFELKSKLTTPKLVDWDQDGDLDLIAGTYEDRENDLGGGVYLALNEGKVGSPKFGALQTLIAPETTQGKKGPTRPDSGLYPDVLDYDGDGDLDLVVAGYSVWQPEGRSLTEQQVVEVETLRAGLKEIEKAMEAHYERLDAIVKEATAGMDEGSKEYMKILEATYSNESKAMDSLWKSSSEMRDQLNALVPTEKRESFTWFYERISS